MVILHIIHRKSVTNGEGGWGNKDCEKLGGPLNVLALSILGESRSMFSWTLVHATFWGGGGGGGQYHLRGG